MWYTESSSLSHNIQWLQIEPRDTQMRKSTPFFSTEIIYKISTDRAALKSSLVILITSGLFYPNLPARRRKSVSNGFSWNKIAALLYKIDCILQPPPIPFQKWPHRTATILFKDKDTTISWWLWEHTMHQLPFIRMLKPLWISGHQEFDIWSDNTVTDWIEPFCFIKHRRRCSLLHYPL